MIENIMKGLSEVVRVGDDIAREKRETNPCLAILRPKGIIITNIITSV